MYICTIQNLKREDCTMTNYNYYSKCQLKDIKLVYNTYKHIYTCMQPSQSLASFGANIKA